VSGGENAWLGVGGRLVAGPAGELVEAANRAEIQHAPRLAAALSAADLAHAVALAEAGALPAAAAARLAEGLLELDAIPPERFPWDPGAGDAFTSREAELARRIGRDDAGWLNAGRPRREGFRVALRLVARDGALDLHDALLDLAAALARRARLHADELAADYTYLQPAQPTTVGHLLLAYAYPALRDAGRMRGLRRELSRSVAGAGGSAGSRWPLRRELLADLLGLEGVVVHAKDAAWQADVYAELLAAVAIAATHLSQLGQDLEIYASGEFGLVELDDAHSRASALMPQKKNPYALVALRAQAGQAAGDVAAALTTLHTGSARTDHFHVLNGLVPRALDGAVSVTRLAAGVVEGMAIDVERAAHAAREGFTAAADVADVLALHAGLDYRAAHQVVGRAVRSLLDAGEPPSALTPAVLAAAAAEVVGTPVAIDASVLADALDPASDAAARPQTGSSSPESMHAMLRDVEREIAAARAEAEAARTAAAAAAERLRARARALAGGS
jgi:argininosuccinate lyase